MTFTPHARAWRLLCQCSRSSIYILLRPRPPWEVTSEYSDVGDNNVHTNWPVQKHFPTARQRSRGTLCGVARYVGSKEPGPKCWHPLKTRADACG